MSYYSDHANDLFRFYQSADPELLNQSWSDLSPDQPGLACDIGAGPGRDAAWLAGKGWDVIAVEPADELRRLGEQHTSTQAKQQGSVTWLDDRLPELKRLRALDQRFQLILVSAVWMHLKPTEHERAMRIISELLAPDGLLVISLRHGPDDVGRFHPFETNDIIRLAQNRALISKRDTRGIADVSRPEVSWDYLAFKLPDDGTGALPLLRHIIVNDNKAATYKLGLLRVLVRIAEGAPGMVLQRSDDWVDIPFGLVGLYWLKTYMPLVLRHNLIQTPTADHLNQRGYGWASKNNFYSLQDLSPYDLRVGATFDAETSRRLAGAISDACANIKRMPANFITWPGQNRQVFECSTGSVGRITKPWQVTKDNLARFGVFRIPANLWQCFSQSACWIEPAIFNEWIRLMQSWRHQYDSAVYANVFDWIDADRDTAGVRARIGALSASGNPVSCVWTSRKLKLDNYAVDHCFPWSRWFNNDLWNLMPSTSAANNSKADKLPSAALLKDSRSNILNWWQSAYLDDDKLSQQFFIEAEAALPLLGPENRSVEDMFHAMEFQRARLRASQQLAEWYPGHRAVSHVSN